MSVLALDQVLVSNDMLRFKHVTYSLFLCLAVYAAIYGISYAYLLHHIGNIIAAWLVGIYLSCGDFSIRRLSRVLEGEDFVTGLPDDCESHVKKKP